MPIRRTIATVATRQFLKSLSRDARLPVDIQQTAQQLLEHFPTGQDVLTLARREGYLQQTVGFSQVFFHWARVSPRSNFRLSSMLMRQSFKLRICFPVPH